MQNNKRILTDLDGKTFEQHRQESLTPQKPKVKYNPDAFRNALLKAKQMSAQTIDMDRPKKG